MDMHIMNSQFIFSYFTTFILHTTELHVCEVILQSAGKWFSYISLHGFQMLYNTNIFSFRNYSHDIETVWLIGAHTFPDINSSYPGSLQVFSVFSGFPLF